MRQGLVNDFVRAFCEDRDGSIWIAQRRLSRWQAGKFQNFNTEPACLRQHPVVVYGSPQQLMDRH